MTATATTGSPGGTEAIPQLAGDTLSVAELYLQQVGLQAGQTLQKSNTRYQSGLVITTSPWAGASVPYGSAVDLLVSTGSPGCQQSSCPEDEFATAMPDISGQTIDQATTTLALDDLTLGSVMVEASPTARGTVICTVPPAGELASLAAPVNVWVSSGDPGGPPATACDASSGPPGSSTGPTQPAVSP